MIIRLIALEKTTIQRKEDFMRVILSALEQAECRNGFMNCVVGGIDNVVTLSYNIHGCVIVTILGVV